MDAHVDNEGFHPQTEQLWRLHGLQAGLECADCHTQIGRGIDYPGALLHDVLRHFKHGGGDVEGVRNEIDCNYRFENPFKENETVKVVKVVTVYDHADEFVTGYERENNPSNGDTVCDRF